MIDTSRPFPEISSALGLLTAGDPVGAESVLSDVCDRFPGHSDAWYLLGASRHAQSRTVEALACMERSLALSPERPDVLNATAMLLLDLGRLAAGLARAEQACTLDLGNPQVWLTAGVILEAMGRNQEGLSCYERALGLRPDWQPGRINRGAVLLRLGRCREALANYRLLVNSAPDQADSHFNLAEALLACGDYADAEQAARRALSLDSRHVGARIDLALSLCMQADFAAARAEFESALSIDREAAEEQFRRSSAAGGAKGVLRAYLHPEDLFLWQHGEMQKACDWRHRAELIQGMRVRAEKIESGTEPVLPYSAVYFHALSLPLDNAQQLSLGRGVAAGVRERAPKGPFRPPTRYLRSCSPLRIGYISPDFRLHPVAYLHWRQMALHGRSRFRVFAYSLHPDDGSMVREKVRAACDEWRPCENDPPELTAARIRYDGIHILVDLSGYTHATRPEILSLRPAPIQVDYMGMPATSGAPFIDYRITDEIATPRDHARYWPEKLVHLPHTLFMYNNRQEIAAVPARRDAGLPEDAFVFSCFNNAFKIEPDVFGIWMRLLLRIPHSVLWLLSDDERVRENLRREAESRGVAAGRLVFAPFLPFEQHLARYAMADLFLDTFYCGAHTTAADALWGGLPVLTCLGETMAARQAASILSAAGLPDMIVSTHEEYEARALQLATHPEELAGIRRRLRDGRLQAPLFDTEGRVKDIESVYLTMWERHASGLPPEGFHVQRARA